MTAMCARLCAPWFKARLDCRELRLDRKVILLVRGNLDNQISGPCGIAVSSMGLSALGDAANWANVTIACCFSATALTHLSAIPKDSSARKSQCDDDRKRAIGQAILATLLL
jgi:hypothetical protein